MEEIIQLDKQLLLMVNGSDSTFLDYLILTLTNGITWIPMYVGLLYVVIKSNKNFREVLLILAAAGVCYLLAGAVDDGIVKPLVARWRPTHDPEIGSLVDVVNNYRGGNYGFFSAHAANTFSIAIFFSLLMRQRMLTFFLVGWSLLNCYTRLYLGVHYPGDITVGLLWGGFVGWLVYQLYRRITIPAKYDIRYCYVPICILGLTFLTAVIMALFDVHL
ncbi:MAG: phosphatase PAP2 family protein [Prevotella sp.]|nr:phosphatase PAP2 family protein [Prevotella sp.]